MDESSEVETPNEEVELKLAIDVDYAYPSRIKSFFHTAVKFKLGKNYLKNSKIIARMINESKRKVKAYWFFTPTTTPDEELLRILGMEKHEVALHVANNPNAELGLLERTSGRKIRYYNIHGTERLIARIMWGRKIGENRASVPKEFPLKYIYERPPLELDVLCYSTQTSQVVKTAEANIAINVAIHFHPEWLFERGTINRRGPVYDALKTILDVDKELDTLITRRKGFARISSDKKEYENSIVPTETFLEKLRDRGVDIFGFIERKWCCPIPETSREWAKAEDNIALLQVTDCERWWEDIGKKTRNMVRKAEKSGIRTEVVEPNDKLAEGIWRIYNETPIRQDRAFPHYGEGLQTVKSNVFSARNCTFIGAFLENELVGFIQLSHGDKISVISQILSFQKDSDKAVNNALVAKAVEVCAAKQSGWLMYGRMGNHPSLDKFKLSNGFVKFPLTRYYIPLTKKGKLTIMLGLNRELKDALPPSVKYPLIPLFNWISRTRMKTRHHVKA